jgi:hypothetical protein
VLRAREHAPTLFPSVVFIFGLVVESIKELGGVSSRGISSCKLTNFVPLGVCFLDLIPIIVLIGTDTNRASVIVIIDWGIAIECNGIDVIGSTLKFEVPT